MSAAEETTSLPAVPVKPPRLDGFPRAVYESLLDFTHHRTVYMVGDVLTGDPYFGRIMFMMDLARDGRQQCTCFIQAFADERKGSIASIALKYDPPRKRRDGRYKNIPDHFSDAASIAAMEVQLRSSPSDDDRINDLYTALTLSCESHSFESRLSGRGFTLHHVL